MFTRDEWFDSLAKASCPATLFWVPDHVLNAKEKGSPVLFKMMYGL